MAGLRSALACIAADVSGDLKRIDEPTLIVHGDDDQIVQIDASARAAAKLVPNAALKEYAGAPPTASPPPTRTGSTPTCSSSSSG